jgi:uncharacterized membrane protein YfcA
VSAGLIATIVVASALGAGVKGVTGMGYPLIAVPLISLVGGVEDAVVAIAAPNLAANVYLCLHARGAAGETRDLWRLAAFGIVGAVIGTVALVQLPDEPLSIAIALTIVGFVVQFVRHPELRFRQATARRWSPVAGTTMGLLQGATGISGPVVGAWFHGYRLTRDAYIFSITLLFGTTGAVQLAILLGQGEMTSGRAWGALAAAIPAALMLPLGVRLRQRLAGRAFDRAVLGVLLVSALSLVVEVVA